MEDSRTHRLRKLLKQLGEAVHGSVTSSEDVRARLQELHDDGWQAVMIVETSLACREDGSAGVEGGTVRLHVDADRKSVRYRIGSGDARLLSSLGISADRHRSRKARVPRLPTRLDGEPGP
jgi:hypothetical protein